MVASANDRGIALTADDELLTALTRQALQSALDAEMAHHRGYDKHNPAGRGTGNSRNGVSPKTVTTEIGQVAVDVPRDRAGTFEPQIVRKHQRQLSGFDEAVISLYGKEMRTGAIAEHLEEVYDTTIWRIRLRRSRRRSPQMRDWQARPLDAVYPVIIIDAIYLNIREGTVASRPVHVAMGVNLDGYRDVLGLWLGPTGGEGAKPWLSVRTELKNRGILDAGIVCCDGLKGLPDAVVQTCVVHLVRKRLRLATGSPGRERRGRSSIVRSMR